MNELNKLARLLKQHDGEFRMDYDSSGNAVRCGIVFYTGRKERGYVQRLVPMNGIFWSIAPVIPYTIETLIVDAERFLSQHKGTTPHENPIDCP